MRSLFMLINAKIGLILALIFFGILSVISGSCYMVQSQYRSGALKTNHDVQKSMHKAHDYRLP